jgi:hypothetical protein
MNSNSRLRKKWNPWQTSLRTLLLVATGIGTLAGIFGPTVARRIREFNSVPPELQPIDVRVNVRFSGEDSNGYFESAETPLH